MFDFPEPEHLGIDVPKVHLDPVRIDQAVRRFDLLIPERRMVLFPGISLNPVPVDARGLTEVGRYLHALDAREFFEVILLGDLRGYSLYLHELFELAWYLRRYVEWRLNPYDHEDRVEHYETAHGWALLVEHRYLQVRSWEDTQLDLSLKELVTSNPHGRFSPDDWRMLATLFRGRISDADLRNSAQTMQQAKDWFEAHQYFPV